MPDSHHEQTNRTGRRQKRRRSVQANNKSQQRCAPTAGTISQSLPLKGSDMDRIHEAVLNILETVGFSEVPESAAELIMRSGGTRSSNNRLCLPRDLVEKSLSELQRDITLCGQSTTHDLSLRQQHVYTGTGGASPLVIDLHTGQYRDSSLADLFNAAKLADALDNVHFFSRSVVARDMPSEMLLDINTAYASLTGTSKHVMVSATNSESVKAIANMCWLIAGSQQAFTDRPFLSLNINHVVSPMRLSEDAVNVLMCASELGIPVHANTFSQLGASTPVTIAGCVAQTMAETLGGMILAWMVNPRVKAICGPRPMVTDLRTGAMSGGSGEQALLTAAAVQMAQYYGLSNSTIAGASDSKIPDAQSGYEKCLSITLAAQAGANLITQACGVNAALMACSFESYVIDNDMLGTILRSMAPIEISDDTLNTDIIKDAVIGEGHFLGQKQTFDRMQTDFLYPEIANRENHETWAASGSPDIRTTANAQAQKILNEHVPNHIDTNESLDTRLTFQPVCPSLPMHTQQV